MGHPQISPPPILLAWTMWGLGASLYLVGFFQRVVPSVITGELMTDFGIGAAGLGNLSAFYFYSYVAMQIPTGILADHWAPRRVMTFGAVGAGLGSMLFALAPNLALACAGRFLIGGSVAVAFVSMMKISSLWMVPRHFALASGLAMLIGILGGVFGGMPLGLSVGIWGWRPVLLVSSGIPFLIAGAIWLIVRDDPQEYGYISYGAPGVQSSGVGALTGLRQIVGYRNTWLLFLIPGGMVGSSLAFAGLWGVPFLTNQYHLSPATAAAVSSALLIAWALASPIFGSLSDRIGRRKPLYVLGAILTLCSWGAIVYVPGLTLPALVFLLILAGFGAGSVNIGFAFAKESVPAHLSGNSGGFCNMGGMLGPMVLQPAIGWQLDRLLRIKKKLYPGATGYDFHIWQGAFSLMIAWLILSLALICFTRETFCRQQL